MTKKTVMKMEHKNQRKRYKIQHCTNMSFTDWHSQMQIPKLYWEGGREVSFDGVPFSVDKVSVLDCQYGVKYWKEKQKKRRD